MEFAPRPPIRSQRENIVPMINVVFLLLIFFLMTAQIAPPVPFDVTPPGSDATDAADGPATLHIATDGMLFFNGAEGDAIFAILPANTRLLIRADAGLEAVELARLLPRLAAAGITDMALITEVAQ